MNSENCRIATVAGKRCQVLLPAGEAVEAIARGKLYARGEQPLVVGDLVQAVREGEQWMVETVAERRNEFVRQGLRKERQVLFANVDRVLIIASLANPTTKLAMIDRFLVAALRGKIHTVLVLTKQDLDEAGARAAEIRAAYEAFDLEIFCVSNVTGAGTEPLRNSISSGVTALVGNSGVGKSALVNSLIPGLDLNTREVSAWSGKGTHTTSAALLVPLRANSEIRKVGNSEIESASSFILHPSSFLVDTPGMKSFVPYGIDKDSLIELFPDLERVAAECRFSDCRHASEPDCAVRSAVERGTLPASRLRSYGRILAEIS